LLLRKRHHGRRGGTHQNHQQARTALHARQRPATHRVPAQEVRRCDRLVGLVGSETLTLTRSPAQLRNDVLAIVRAGIRACAADALVDRALAGAGGTSRAGGTSKEVPYERHYERHEYERDERAGSATSRPHGATSPLHVGHRFSGASLVVIAAGKAAPA